MAQPNPIYYGVILKQLLYGLLPTVIRIQGRSYFGNCLLDIRDQLLGSRNRLIPPNRLNISGDGPFLQLGKHNVLLCRELAALSCHDSVLDVGCGIGRTALALTDYLSNDGTHVGLDVIRFAIQWCTDNIQSRYDNFSFVHADVYNRTYNGKGHYPANTYVFPFGESMFTFCIATSLFTHLLPLTMSHYVLEISRVLKVDAQFFSSWFLLRDQENPLIASKIATDFPHKFDDHSQRSLYAPEQAVAYRLDYVRQLFESANLRIERVEFGGWSGRERTVDFGQDIIVAKQALPDSRELNESVFRA